MKPAIYENLEYKPKAVIFDIDGVISNSSERFKRIDLRAFDRKDVNSFIDSIKEYNKDCEGDLRIEEGFELLEFYASKYKIFFITARGEMGWDATYDWLVKNIPESIKDNFTLYMHQECYENFEFTDQEEHAEFKRKVALEILKSYDIVWAIDDSINNINAYLSIGIPVLHMTIPSLGRVLV